MKSGLSPLRAGGELLSHVLNIAHRGARAFTPENTIAAFEKAIRFNCQMIELDVHMSMDGELVVHHDDQLTRCTDVKIKFPGRSTYFVSEFEYNTLYTLRCRKLVCRTTSAAKRCTASFFAGFNG